MPVEDGLGNLALLMSVFCRCQGWTEYDADIICLMWLTSSLFAGRR
jgi:hypothetical protein